MLFPRPLHVRDRSQAVRRWNDELRDRFGDDPSTFGRVIEMIDAELRDAATRLEIRRRGAGVEHIVYQLRDRIPDLDRFRDGP